MQQPPKPSKLVGALRCCAGILLVGGAVGGIIAINHNGKLEQGNAAPAAIKGKASELMVPRKHGTCVDTKPGTTVNSSCVHIQQHNIL